MDTKKTKQKDLENKKSLFFEVGLAVALLMTFFAFEWRAERTYDRAYIPPTIDAPTEIPMTITKVPEPPAAKVNAAIITDIINITNEPIAPIELIVDIPPAGIDTAIYKYAGITKKVEAEDPDETFPIYQVQKPPLFEGDNANTFVKWVYNQLKYPAEAERNGVEGNVIIGFVITKTGTLKDIKVIRTADPVLSDEVVRVVKLSPEWVPAMQGTRKVNVTFQMSIQFRLQQ